MCRMRGRTPITLTRERTPRETHVHPDAGAHTEGAITLTRERTLGESMPSTLMRGRTPRETYVHPDAPPGAAQDAGVGPMFRV